jgi:zinc/manganese transport system permease protein
MITLLNYEFMRHAFMASGLVALIAGIVGFFLVMREQTFAGHALSHIGFSGATGAALLGLPPLWGLLGLTVAGGIGMGALGERLSRRDIAVGMILTICLSLGLLFLHFLSVSTSHRVSALELNALLFGNVLGVSTLMLQTLAILTTFSLLSLAWIARPLIFSTLQPELAQAKGISLSAVSILFLAITAIVVAECSQIVGVLLVFTLLVGPAAAAQNFCHRLYPSLFLSAILAVIEAWLGIAFAFYTNWPTGFWISALSALVYGISILVSWGKERVST